MDLQRKHSQTNSLSSAREQNTNDLPSTLFTSPSESGDRNGNGAHGADQSGFPNAVAPWRQTSCFLGRESELEQLKALKDKIIGEHQSNAASAPHPQEPSTDEANDNVKTKPTSTSAPKTTKEIDVHPAVLVWGLSGTGKSALIDHFLETCCVCNTTHQQQNTTEQVDAAPSCSCCFVVRGKYDEYTGQSDPFSAIVQAIQDFVAQLKCGPKAELDRIRECVRAAFPTDGFQPLIKVIPSLSILSPKLIREDASVGSHSISHRDNCSSSMHDSEANGDTSSLPTSNAVQTDKTWNQLQYIFAKFIKAISTKERPIYMFLDDLQWSASVGLDLIAHMVADTQLHNFMLLGAIRQDVNPHSDEPLNLTPDHPLARCLLKPLSPDEDEEDNQGTAAGTGIDDESAMTASTSKSNTNKRRHPRKLHQISIANLKLAEMIAWLSGMLECDGIDILSEKLHAKTNGNIFFTLQALEELERKNVLVFSPVSHQWEWSLAKPGDEDRNNGSSSQLPISDSIIGIIESKLRELPEKLQRVLSVAAYIRSMFDISVLLRVLENECKHVDGAVDTMDGISTAQELSKMLEHAVLERLISNPIGGTTYHFAHDRIQQAAYGMIPFGEARDKLRVRIGSCLLHLYRRMQVHLQQEEENGGVGPSSTRHRKNRKKALLRGKATQSSQSTDSSTSAETSSSSSSSISDVDDGLLFVAADHLNSVQTKDHMFSVTMNLEVGEKALKMAALQAASSYLKKAHQALGRVRSNMPTTNDEPIQSRPTDSSSIWDNDKHYEVCLKLCRARADVELSLSNFDVGYKLCNEVLEKARSMDDKVTTYFSMARALGREDRHAESVDVELRLLWSLKSFPKRWYSFHTATSMMKIKRFLKNNTNEEILARPWMKDPKKLCAMKISVDLLSSAQTSGDMVLTTLNLSKMLCRSIKHGLCIESANALAIYARVVGSMGDQATATRCVTLGHNILEQAGEKQLQGHFRYNVAFYIMQYTLPYHELLRHFRRGYLDSMEVGDFGIGIINYQGAILMGYQRGLELGPLNKANDIVLDQLESYKVDAFRGMADTMRVLFRTLSGEEPIDWELLDKASRRDVTKETLDPSKLLADCMFFITSVEVALYHRRYEIGEGLLRNYIFLTGEDPSAITRFLRTYNVGIFAASNYRETGNRHCLPRLRKAIKQLRHIIKTRGRIWAHRTLLLEAEQLSITMKNKLHSGIQHAYNIAIIAATKAGCIQDVALANELAGEHYARHGCKAMAGSYFVHAVDYYKAWGCKSKVTDIKKRHKRYMRTSSDPTRQRPEGLADDGNGNYLFGITRDVFTGAVTNRCAGLDAFVDRSNGSAGCGSAGNALVFGSEVGDGGGVLAGLADDDDVSVLTEIE